MNKLNLRQIMTAGIKASGWMDVHFERGDMNAKDFSSYEEWLNSLSDRIFCGDITMLEILKTD